MPKFFKIILTVIVSIPQLSFLSSFEYLNHLNLILILAILLLFLNSQFLLYFTIISGIILDIYSVLPFPLITLTLALTAALLNLLFKNFFTNRSLYSLILLGFIGTAFYNFILNFLIFITYFLKLSESPLILDKIYFSNLLWQFITNLVFLIIFWLIRNYFKFKLRKTFFLKT